MDTSKEYIKMCEAEEIQGLWKPYNYDNIYDLKSHREGFMLDVRGAEFPFIIWLPRQDQLQEMMNYSLAPLGIVWHFFWHVYGKDEEEKKREYWSMFNSMEQLWLAFVMSEHYSKVWNGEGWVMLEEM